MNAFKRIVCGASGRKPEAFAGAARRGLSGIGACALVALTACGGGGTEDPQELPKLLVLGNSITFAPATPSLPWDHGSGMAASDAAHDFAHLVGTSLGAAVSAINVSRQGLEGNGIVDAINQVTVYPVTAAIAEDIAGVDAQTTVIVELGDNVQDIAAFTPVYGQLLDAASKGRRLVCLSTWWRNDAKDAMMKTACLAHGGAWVFIGDILPVRQDDVGRYSNPAVDGHPHDWSMGMIAQRVLVALRP